jgi:hypothetical protein
MFTREYAEGVWKKAEKWFNKLPPGGQLDAVYDAYVVHITRKKEVR